MSNDKSFLALFAEQVARSHELNAKEEGDYIGDDGLLHCGKCHELREQPVTVEDENGNPIVFRPYIPCRCIMAKINKMQAAQENAEKADARAAARNASCIPPQYRDVTFDTFKKNASNAAILHMTKRFATNFSQILQEGGGLLLHGNVGTGKTYAAACIANYLLDHDFTVFFTSTYTMTQLRDEAQEAAYSARISKCSLLIVDDLGAERSSQFAQEKVFGYIDTRCNAEKPMILTTNLDFKAMLSPETEAEQRIYDRILKKCFPVAFAGESWRRGEARSNFEKMKALLQGSD